MMNMAMITDFLAACGVGTVKKRIRMCGIPAVPSTRAMPSEIWSSGFFRYSPGSRKRWPASMPFRITPSLSTILETWSWISGLLTIVSKKAIGLKPALAITRTESSRAPDMSRPALMICTQVVATMPPKTT